MKPALLTAAFLVAVACACWLAYTTGLKEGHADGYAEGVEDGQDEARRRYVEEYGLADID